MGPARLETIFPSLLVVMWFVTSDSSMWKSSRRQSDGWLSERADHDHETMLGTNAAEAASEIRQHLHCKAHEQTELISG